jgi:hypothetical protein
MYAWHDKNHLLRLLKGDLGFGIRPAPTTDNEFYQCIILDRALPTFSVLEPYREKIIMDIFTDAVADREDPVNIDGDSVTINTLLRIPPVKQQRILGVASVRPHNRLSNLSMSSSFEAVESYQDLAQAQSLADLASILIPPMTFEYKRPDKLRLYNNHTYTSKIEVEVKYEHHPELYTIPDTQRESFYTLALLSAKAFLFNNLDMYSGFRTAYGEVDLKIDKWSNAEDDLNNLLKEWEELYHLDQPNIFWI